MWLPGNLTYLPQCPSLLTLIGFLLPHTCTHIHHMCTYVHIAYTFSQCTYEDTCADTHAHMCTHRGPVQGYSTDRPMCTN